MKQKKNEYTFTVMYSMKYYDWGNSFDSQIEKVAKAKIGGSGAGFGWRDVSLYFPTKRKADNAFKKLKEHFGKKLKFFDPPKLVEYY